MIEPSTKSEDFRIKQRALNRLLKEETAESDTDCLAALSGGKDSVYQLHVLVEELGLRTVACTWDHYHHRPTAFRLARQVVKQLGEVEWICWALEHRWIRIVLYSFLMDIKNNCMCPHFMLLRALPYVLQRRIPVIAIGYSPDQNYRKGKYRIPAHDERRSIVKEWIDAFETLVKLSVARHFPGQVQDCVDYLFGPVRRAVASADQAATFPFILQLSEFVPWDRQTVETTIAVYGWDPSLSRAILHTNCMYQAVRGYIEFARDRQFIRSELEYGLMRGEISDDEANEELRHWNYRDEYPSSLNSYLQYLGMSEREFDKALSSEGPPEVVAAFGRFLRAIYRIQGWDPESVGKIIV